MAKGKIIITGHKKIDAMLRKIANPKVTDKIVKDAMKKNLKSLLSVAKSNAPVDSGAYKRAMKVVAGKRSRKGPSMRITVRDSDINKMHLKDAKAAAKKASKKSGTVVEPAEVKPKHYAATVEYGSEDRPPDAPMRRAFDGCAQQTKDGTLSDIRDGVMKELRK